MDVFETLIRERNAGRTTALAVIVNAVGSIPAHASAKLLLLEDGSFVGTVGGGLAEAKVLEAAREVLATGEPRTVHYDLHESLKVDLGMVCGGHLDVFIEAIRPPPVAFIFGGGHVGALTADAVNLARISVEIVDDRPEFADPQRFPYAKAVHCGPLKPTLDPLKPNDRSLIFIAMRSHEIDAEVLRWAVKTPAAYIGMLGSRRKVLTVYSMLKKEGVTPEQFARVHAPVGINIGAESPEEIAISVAAEMIATIRAAEAARPLMLDMQRVADAVLPKDRAVTPHDRRTAA